ncbi:MAG: hypothetical protein ACP6IU_10110 [Candidatus Asgardarchaeia archaeon]
MAPTRMWSPVPLRNIILEILMKHRGVMIDTDLFDNIVRYYSDLSFNEFNKELMRLEIDGLLYVSPITKTKRKVEIIKPGQNYMGVSED